MRIKVTRLRLFPWIPLVPLTLLIGSLTMAIRAFVRVRRLEHRLAA